MLRFSIITPAFNAEQHIEETILSVLQQTAFLKGCADLEYVLCDGGSSDATCEIATSVLEKSGIPNWRILSQPDQGMYEAIVRGMQCITGDICAYLNAGDLLAPHAIEILAEVFSSSRIQWVSGIKVVINDFSQIIRVRFPFKYRRRFIHKGYYGEFLPFIQQDACFWRTSLHKTLDMAYLSSLKLAGDYYMWHRFSTEAELFIVNTHISGFRIHPGQKSEDKPAYRAEKLRFITRNPLILATDLPLILWDWWFMFADHVRNRVNRKTLIEFNPATNKWMI